jgi:hypothetical protein
MRRTRAGGTEEFIVTWRASATSFFHRRWNDMVGGGEGGWEMVNAIVVPDLDDLYSTASAEQKMVLDSQRWNPDQLRWHAK